MRAAPELLWSPRPIPTSRRRSAKGGAMVSAPEHAHGGCGSSTTIALAGRAADEYDAALARLLAEAVRRPGLLERFGRKLRSAMTALYDRECEAAEHLDPEYWFLAC